MSRNKENIPLNRPQRPHGALYSSSPKLLPSDEFFTDSLLDATRLSSRIPTPSPQKAPITKPRRARNRIPRNALPAPLRASTSDSVNPPSRNRDVPPSTPHRNGTPNKLRTNSLTSLPSLRDELPLASPYSGIYSPPSKDLTDTYQRIEDEEDLAQTERELSSEDGNPSDIDEPQRPQPEPKPRSKSESPLKAPSAFKLHSAASTPTKSFSLLHKEKRLSAPTETLSEASGLSFLRDMTDQDLAAKLTPHISESARDRARLKEVWGHQRPIAFGKAQTISRVNSNGEIKGEISGPSPRMSPKVTAFSRASKPGSNALFYDSPLRDRLEAPGSQVSDVQSQYSNSDAGTRSDGQRALPMNTAIERKFSFSTNHGFPPHRPALTEQNLEQQNRGGPNLATSPSLRFSAPSMTSGQPIDHVNGLSERSQVTNPHVSRLPQFRGSTRSEGKPSIVQEPSQIDWAAAAADVPIPSVEDSFESEKKDSTPTFLSRFQSPDKSRRWDNDFTGQSFQVSESPPVRQKQPVLEETRHREIAGIAKQAVATNRLSEIRERQSQENLRSASRSPAPRSTPRSSEGKLSSISIEENGAAIVVEPVPDTPVVIYRSSSNGGSDKSSEAKSSIRPSIDRSKSHDHLQRLARAMSSTPRSSPAPEREMSQPRDLPPKDDNASAGDRSVSQKSTAPSAQSLKPKEEASSAVAQTPRVVGAWTDTILPDTVKTVKQASSANGYAQTPHINAGGWTDTPAPIIQRKYSGNVPTIIEEVSEMPEELTAGIAKDTASSDTIKIQLPSDRNVMIVPSGRLSNAEQPKSALASILDKQKNRLVSQDITTASREDTLNLGNETIESLQDLLDLNEDDLTTLSRLSVAEDDTRPLGEAAAEAELLERLGVKIDRLRHNLHDARKGISRLEHKVAEPSEPKAVVTPQQLLSDTICEVCHQHTFQPHQHPDLNSRFPYASLVFSIPIPLLFRPRTNNQWLPRPTLIGAITLTIWAWYLVECTMCELYCRPAFTDFYIWPTEKEPEFPFVLPTMLARWTGLNNLALDSLLLWIWTAVARLIRAFGRLISISAGWSDGFVDDPATATKVVRKIVETATAAATDAFDMSLDDDEYL